MNLNEILANYEIFQGWNLTEVDMNNITSLMSVYEKILVELAVRVIAPSLSFPRGWDIEVDDANGVNHDLRIGAQLYEVKTKYGKYNFISEKSQFHITTVENLLEGEDPEMGVAIRSQYAKALKQPLVLILNGTGRFIKEDVGMKPFYQELMIIRNMMARAERPIGKDRRNVRTAIDDDVDNYIDSLEWWNESFDSDKFPSLEEMVREFRNPENIRKIEAFVNGNFLDSNQLGEVIKDTFTNYNCTHPFNKVKNLEENNCYTGAGYLCFLNLGRKSFEILPHHLEDVTEGLELKEFLQAEESAPEAFIRINKLKHEIAVADTTANYRREVLKNFSHDIKKSISIETEKQNLTLLEKFKIKLSNEQLEEVQKLNTHETTFHITTKGNVVGSAKYDKSWFLRKGRVDKMTWNKRKREACELKLQDYMSKVDESVKWGFDPIVLIRPDLSDAYSNKYVQSFVDRLDEIGEKIMAGMCNNWCFTQAYRWAQLQTTLLMESFTSSEGSKFYFKAGRCPRTGVYFTMGASPDNKQSGPIILFGRFPSDTQWPKWISMQSKKIFTDGTTLFSSKIFRTSWNVASSSLDVLFGAMSIYEYAETIGINFGNNARYWSLFWNYSACIKKMLDVQYSLDKNSMFLGTLGAIEAKSKLKVDHISDVRLAGFLYDMGEGYSTYHNSIFKGSKKKNFSNLNAVHPYFKVVINDVEGLNLMVYLKQSSAKTDNAAEGFLMRNFAKKEIEYEEEMKNNPFDKTRMRPDNPMGVTDFINKCFKDTTWVKSAYLPALAYRMTEKYLAECPTKKFDPESHDRLGIDTQKMSSILVPASWNNKRKSLEEIRDSAKRQKKRAKGDLDMESYQYYKGKQFLAEDEIRKRDLKNLQTEKNKRKKVPEGDLSVSDRAFVSWKTTECILRQEAMYNKGEDPLTFWQLSVKSMIDSPRNTLVKPELKLQMDYNKRQFFIQYYSSRHINKCLDEVGRPILASTKDDILLERGPGGKNIEIQQHFEEIVRLMNHAKYIPSKHVTDMTKFGDKYMVGIMIVYIRCLADKGYINYRQFVIFRETLERLQNRLCLISPVVLKQIHRMKLEDTNTLTPYERMKWEEIYNLTLLIKTNMLNKGINIDTNLNEEQYVNWSKELMYVTNRTYGAVLGVFNITWSIFSSQIKNFSSLVLQDITHRVCFTSETNSDDSSDTTIFPLPGVGAFTDFRCTEMIEQLGNGTLRVGKTRKGVKIIREDGSKQRLENFKLSTLDKYILCVQVAAAKMFSQTPSLFKTAIGFVSEILQQVTLATGEIFLPIVRYVAKITNESPTESFGRDTMNTASRVLDVLTNGGTEIICHELLVIGSMYSSERYGIPMESRSVHLHPNIGGVYYCLPTLMLQSGTGANEARLLMNLDHSPNILAKTLSVMINGDEMWDFSNGSLPEVYKDFLMSWGKTNATREGADRLEEIGGQLMENSNIGLTWEDIIRANKLLDLGSSKDSLIRTAYFWDKYTKPEISFYYKKVSARTQNLNRKGWLRRVRNNPFNIGIRGEIGALSTTLTMEQIIGFIKILATKDNLKRNIIDASLSYRRYKLQREIEDLMNFSVIIKQSLPKDNPQGQYKRIGIERATVTEAQVKTAATQFSFSLLVEGDKTRFVRLMRGVKEPKGGFLNPEIFGNICNSLGIFTNSLPEERIEIFSKHRDAIIGLMSEERVPSVVKVVGDSIMSRLQYNMFYKTEIEVEVGFIERTSIITDIGTVYESLNNLQEHLNIALVASGNNHIESFLYKNIGFMKTVNTFDMLERHFTSSQRKNYFWATSLQLIMRFITKTAPIHITLSGVFRDTHLNKIRFKFYDWPEVILERIPFREELNRFKVLLRPGTPPWGMTQYNYLSRMIDFMSQIFFFDKNYNKGFLKCEDKTGTSMYKAIGTHVFEKADRHGMALYKADTDGKWVEGNYTPNGFAIRERTFTPWRVHKSEISMMSQVTFNGRTLNIIRDYTPLKMPFEQLEEVYVREFGTARIIGIPMIDIVALQQYRREIAPKSKHWSLLEVYSEIIRLEIKQIETGDMSLHLPGLIGLHKRRFTLGVDHGLTSFEKFIKFIIPTKSHWITPGVNIDYFEYFKRKALGTARKSGTGDIISNEKINEFSVFTEVDFNNELLENFTIGLNSQEVQYPLQIISSMLRHVKNAGLIADIIDGVQPAIEYTQNKGVINKAFMLTVEAWTDFKLSTYATSW